MSLNDQGNDFMSVPVQLVDHGGVSVASHHHLLLFQLLSHLARKKT